MNKRGILAILLCAIFTFWLILTKNNYFHWDEWSFLLGFNQSPLNFLTKSYGEHYIPLNLLNHYLLFQTFGLNNLPFQLSVLFFHLLNCLIIVKIVFRKTGHYLLSILAVLVFGISNVYVEDVIWSQGISNVASATFVFLAYYLYILRPKNLKIITISAGSLLIAPLFNDLAILMPLAFLVMVFLDQKSNKKFSWRLLVPYFLVGIINLSVIFYFSNSAISHSAKLSMDSIYKIPQFILYGILRGSILRFIYPGFHFLKGFQETKVILVSLVSLLTLIGSSLFILNWLGDKETRSLRFKNLFILTMMIVTGYLAVALGRSTFGLAQAGISRYAYQPFFFLILLLCVILKNYIVRIKFISLIAVVLFAINVISVVRFETEFWSKMVGRDRQFVQDTTYLFDNNAIICDSWVPGIFPQIKLSRLWFLHPQSVFLEKDCQKILEGLYVDNKTKEIYQRISTDYQHKFD